MKTILSLLTIFFLVANSIAQDKPKKTVKQTLEIDLQSNILKLSIPVAKGADKIKLIHLNKTYRYEVSIKKEDIVEKKLSIPNQSNKPDEDSLKINSIPDLYQETINIEKLKRNQSLTVNIVVYKPKENTDKTVTYTKEKELIYTFTTQKRGEWNTSFGFNFIRLGDRDTFFSKPVDSSFVITKGEDQKRYDFHPSIMFTWLQNNTKDINFGVNGGLGFDLQNSLSVFLGGSAAYRRNIIISVGIAIHNQELLNSQYKEGDIIMESLDFDQLHTEYTRINPYISIAFRLDKSPF